jgi:hypothetical protein
MNTEKEQAQKDGATHWSTFLISSFVGGVALGVAYGCTVQLAKMAADAINGK